MDYLSIACPSCGADAGEPCVFYGDHEHAGEETGFTHTARRGRVRRGVGSDV